MRKLTVFLSLAAAVAVLPGCDAFGGGDPTIGGTYSGQATQGNLVLTIPADTESDPDATVDITGVDISTRFTGTATYDFPDLDVTIRIAGQSGQFSCDVADDGDTLTCQFLNGTGTLTRN